MQNDYGLFVDRFLSPSSPVTVVICIGFSLVLIEARRGDLNSGANRREGFKGLVQEEIVASPDYLMLVEYEATIVGSSDSSRSPLYEASAEPRQPL